MKILPILVILFPTLLTTGEGLVCYECSGFKIKDCYPPVDKSSVKAFDCESSTFIAAHDDPSYKCIAYLERNKLNNETSYARHCINTRQKNFCETYKTNSARNNIAVEDCKVCTEDFCNGAETLKMTLLVVLTLLALSWSLF